MLRRFRAAGLVWPTLVAIPAFAVLIGLGVWQWQRMDWKNSIVARIEARGKEAPLPQSQALELSCGVRDGRMSQACEYLRVRLTGTFEHGDERHIFAGVHAVDGRSSVGYWVFTPFRIKDAGPTVYVNRGFVPEALKDPAKRLDGRPNGDVEIVAQIRSREDRGLFDATNDAGKNMYFVRAPSELGGSRVMASAPDGDRLGSNQLYLEIVSSPGQSGFPRPLAGTITIINKHFEYALTWWALALTLVGVYVAFALGRLRLGA